MENLVSFNGIFRGRSVWLSGHTGFKGAWLAEWLLNLGAEVHGFALEPNTSPALFNQLCLAGRLDHQIADVRDLDSVRESIRRAQPDFVFHLAAQALVRASYEQPVETFAVNLMGTINVLESLRGLHKRCAAVLVTSDKCYENSEQGQSYGENDRLGGYDPYSSSKAAAELGISAYRRSFFKNHPVKIASARAGNVIGGGDWARDRIVPDCIRALHKEVPIPVRNPRATRPWQHVLEPLGGYLRLAALMADPGRTAPRELNAAFNFGPDDGDNRSVRELVENVLKHWPGAWEDHSRAGDVHEAGLLQLAIDKARATLGWHPVWDFDETVRHTVDWYRRTLEFPDPDAVRRLTVAQIAEYVAKARKMGLAWVRACDAETKFER